MNGVADSSSLNKPIKINLNIYMHIFYFFIFFIFLFIFLGQGWTQPARPGHWPKPMTRLGNMKHAWTKSRVHEQIKELKLECTVGSELKWKAGKEKLTYLGAEWRRWRAVLDERRCLLLLCFFFFAFFISWFASVCLSRYISLLFSEHLSTLSRPVSSLVFLGSVLVRGSLFLVWEFWR